MIRVLAKSKIHRCRVTDKNLAYEGSITIDEELMQRADLIEGELVQVINVTTGARFETYCMRGARHSGAICLNGGTARLGEIGDELIIISYAMVETVDARSLEMRKVSVDAANRPTR